MKINRLKLNFLNINYGWLPFNISSNGKEIIRIAASGVYNPFPEYTRILKKISKRKFKKIEFYIDQEGFDAKLTFTDKGNNILIETETIKDNLSSHDLPKFKGLFNKKQVLLEMSTSLLSFYYKNKKEMNNDWYSFWFRENELKKVIRNLKNS